MSTLRVGITGATGYVGSQLAARFRERGWSVIALQQASVHDHTDTRPFSLSEPVAPHLLRDLDALIHAAYDFRARTWEDTTHINIEGSRRLFEEAKAAGISTIFISSISAYPGCVSVYGRTKLAIEELARRNNVQSVRPGLVYGAVRGSMIGRLERLTALPIIPLIGDGHQIQYLIHIRDLADVIAHLLLYHLNIDAPMTVAHPDPKTIREILTVAAAHHGKHPRFVPIAPELIRTTLRVAESLHIPLPYHSDSFDSLLHQNPHPDFSAVQRLGIHLRPFSLTTWNQPI